MALTRLSASPKRGRRLEGKGAVAGGADVVALDKASKAEERRKHLHKLGGLADAYFIAAAEGTHKGGPKAAPKRATTIAEEKRIFEKLVKPKFGESAVANITRIEIRDFVAKQAKAAKSNGRHCRNIIRQLMSFAVREGVIDYNPAHDIAVAAPKVRTTVLKDSDLKAFWLACQRPQDVEDLAMSKLMGIALRMAAVTLQRGGEVVGMRWAEIDRAAKTWLIPAERMKGRSRIWCRSAPPPWRCSTKPKPQSRGMAPIMCSHRPDLRKTSRSTDGHFHGQ